MTGVDRMPRVVYDRQAGGHLVVVVLDADEAEAIALALGPGDAGGRELQELAEEARALDARSEDGAP